MDPRQLHKMNVAKYWKEVTSKLCACENTSSLHHRIAHDTYPLLEVCCSAHFVDCSFLLATALHCPVRETFLGFRIAVATGAAAAAWKLWCWQDVNCMGRRLQVHGCGSGIEKSCKIQWSHQIPLFLNVQPHSVPEYSATSISWN